MENKDNTIENIRLIVTLHHRALCEVIENGKLSPEKLDIIKDQLELAKNDSRQDLSVVAYALQIKLRSIHEIMKNVNALKSERQELINKMTQFAAELTNMFNHLSDGNYLRSMAKSMEIEQETNRIVARIKDIDKELDQYCIKLDETMGDNELKLTLDILHNSFDLKKIDIFNYDLKDFIEWLFEYLSDEQLDEIRRSITLTQPNGVNVNTDDTIN